MRNGLVDAVLHGAAAAARGVEGGVRGRGARDSGDVGHGVVVRHDVPHVNQRTDLGCQGQVGRLQYEGVRWCQLRHAVMHVNQQTDLLANTVGGAVSVKFSVTFSAREADVRFTA